MAELGKKAAIQAEKNWVFFLQSPFDEYGFHSSFQWIGV